MNFVLAYALVFSSIFEQPCRIGCPPIHMTIEAISSTCMEAAATALIKTISVNGFSNAQFQVLDDGVRQARGSGIKSLITLNWEDVQKGGVWLKGYIILEANCQSAEFQVTEQSANLKSTTIPSYIDVEQYDPQKGMGLGRRPTRTLSNNGSY